MRVVRRNGRLRTITGSELFGRRPAIPSSWVRAHEAVGLAHKKVNTLRTEVAALDRIVESHGRAIGTLSRFVESSVDLSGRIIAMLEKERGSR